MLLGLSPVARVVFVLAPGVRAVGFRGGRTRGDPFDCFGLLGILDCDPQNFATAAGESATDAGESSDAEWRTPEFLTHRLIPAPQFEGPRGFRPFDTQRAFDLGRSFRRDGFFTTLRPLDFSKAAVFETQPEHHVRTQVDLTRETNGREAFLDNESRDPFATVIPAAGDPVWQQEIWRTLRPADWRPPHDIWHTVAPGGWAEDVDAAPGGWPSPLLWTHPVDEPAVVERPTNAACPGEQRGVFPQQSSGASFLPTILWCDRCVRDARDLCQLTVRRLDSTSTAVPTDEGRSDSGNTSDSGDRSSGEPEGEVQPIPGKSLKLDSKKLDSKHKKAGEAEGAAEEEEAVFLSVPEEPLPVKVPRSVAANTFGGTRTRVPRIVVTSPWDDATAPATLYRNPNPAQRGDRSQASPSKQRVGKASLPLPTLKPRPKRRSRRALLGGVESSRTGGFVDAKKPHGWQAAEHDDPWRNLVPGGSGLPVYLRFLSEIEAGILAARLHGSAARRTPRLGAPRAPAS